MFKPCIALCLLAALCWSSAQAASFDSADVVPALKDDRVLQAYVKCILGTGECTEPAKRLQAIVPNALQQKCSQCTDQQKVVVATVLAKVQKSFPADWEKVLQKFDPEKKFRADITALLTKANPAGLAATTPKPK